MKEITLDTKIADLLNEYEGMKEILIQINPKFKKLNNPVLRRTLAKIAGVKQAAIVGGMDPYDLLNQLREAVGQKPLEHSAEGTESETVEVPEWTGEVPVVTLDANVILDEDRNPLAELRKAMKPLEGGEIVVIESDFKPEPLIDEMAEKGHEVFSVEVAPERFVTYVKK